MTAPMPAAATTPAIASPLAPIDQFTGQARPLNRIAVPANRAERRRQLKAVVLEFKRRQPPSDLHEKQLVAFSSQATELMYGGAAGGGKSHLMRRAAIQWCQWIPGLQVYLFRRTFPDLFKNHMTGPGSFPVLLGDLVDSGDVRIHWGTNQIEFVRTGSMIHLCHCQYEKNVYSYQGAEIHVLLIDELTQWSRSMYTFLRSRVRLGGLKIPKWLKHIFPRILCGANPGGIGHNWVKADFVDIAPETTITQMPENEGGMRRQFIRALLEDNPTQTDNDPQYESRLMGISDAALAKAMRRGDWDIIAGGFFDDIWDREIHVIKPFAIPKSWRIDRSFDWGSSKPFSVGWWAESDGTKAPNGATYPRGTLFRIAEWYGWNGKANEGCKMLAADVARGIVQREAEWRKAFGWYVHAGPADSSIFAVEDGHSIARSMQGVKPVGVAWTEANKTPGSRKTGWERLREMLAAAKPKYIEGRALPLEAAGLFVFDTCVHFIRTVPTLPRDKTISDDVDTHAEDHVGDESRYKVTDKRRNTAVGVGSFGIG